MKAMKTRAYMSCERPDRLEEACAVFGVYAPGEDVARLTCFGLQALQHRGQESCGIAVGDGETILIHKDLGLVDQVFDEEALRHLNGNVAIGHTRYSTAGGGGWKAAQPHVSAIDDELIALAHNGTLIDTTPQRAWLANEGVQLYGYTDSEVAARTIGVDTQRTGHIRSGIKLMMQQLHGAYAIVLVSSSALYAFRDPMGIRPLSLATMGDDNFVVASETCAFNTIGDMIAGNGGLLAVCGAVLVYFIGHLLNLLLSAISAFVHPLRLNFVEYFKNSGYEGRGTGYEPLK